jgi:hypothetical protein
MVEMAVIARSHRTSRGQPFIFCWMPGHQNMEPAGSPDAIVDRIVLTGRAYSARIMRPDTGEGSSARIFPFDKRPAQSIRE